MKKNLNFFVLVITGLLAASCSSGHSNHTPGDPVIENKIEATCTKEGSYDSVTYCIEGHEELSREHIVLPALGHDYKKISETHADYDHAGYFTYKCSRCDDTYTEPNGEDRLKYTVTWKNYDNEELLVEHYYKGETPVFKGHTPEKEMDNYYEYVFDGWTPSIDVVQENTVYVATFKGVKRLYNVTFETNGGSDVDIQQIEYGAKVTKPADPSKAEYIFDGWYSNAECTEIFDFDAQVFGGTTIYANFVQDLEYRLSETKDYYSVMGPGNYTGSNLEIPAYLHGIPVEEIGPNAFLDQNQIKSIKFSNGLKRIKWQAFYNVDITTLNVPDSVNYIGNQAFKSISHIVDMTGPSILFVIGVCSTYTWVEKITITSGETLEENSISSCRSIKELTLPSTLKDIKNNCFYNCEVLEKVVFNDGLLSIGDSAFNGCPMLKEIVIPTSLHTFGKYGSVNLPSTFQYNEYDNGLYLGNELNPYQILVKAKDTNITSCVIHPDTVSISPCVFANCSSLKDITISKNIKYIGLQAFGSKTNVGSLNKNTYENGYYLGDSNDKYTVLLKCIDTSTQCVINENCRAIYDYALEGCKVNADVLNIPESVSSIGQYAFKSCNVKEVYIPEGVIRISSRTFYQNTNLHTVHLPSTIEEVVESAFDYCKVSKINYPKSLRYIEGGGYYYNNVTLNVYYEGDLHSWCSISLSYYGPTGNVYFLDDNGTETFDGKKYSRPSTLNVPSDIGVLNRQLERFKENEIVLNEGLASIGEYAFSANKAITSIRIPESVDIIMRYAFSRMESLKTVTIGRNISHIYQEAFYACSKLETVIFEGTIDEWKSISINGDAWYSCLAKTVQCVDGTVLL